MKFQITSHPILEIPQKRKVWFTHDGTSFQGYKGMMIASALIMNGITIFGHHPNDGSPQGIFCANGQCAQCTVIVNDKPVKSCMTPLEEGMIIKSCNGLPSLPEFNNPLPVGNPSIKETDILIIGGGPAGLSASKVLLEEGIKVILIDDKERLGGKLILQTHKFFGSQHDVYAGKRGIEIARILEDSIEDYSKVEIWRKSTALAIFSDGLVGVLKEGKEYVLIRPRHLLIATGAREKMLIFPGDTLPGVYGAGAFQTLVNRDLVKPAEKLFIVGGGNVGLIAGYHAIQAGIHVVGLIEAMPYCGGYQVHVDKLRRLGVPIYTKHTILAANGTERVESIVIAELDESWNPIEGTEKTFPCDTILLAVGLNPINEFYEKALEFNLDTWIAGDAQEIAEASAAIFSGKIEAYKILEHDGYKIAVNIHELEDKLNQLKSKPLESDQPPFPLPNKDLYPLFHCTQKIPCNPCTTVCPQEQIATIDDMLTQLPYFKGEKECIGCGRCVAVCPGLAVTLIDYRKDKLFPLVTFPFELSASKLIQGQKVTVMSNTGNLGEYTISRVRTLKEYSHTQLVSIKLPKEIAVQAVGITTIQEISVEPLKIYHKPPLPDSAIVCRCERITAGEIRKWIRKGVTDINELKALTRVTSGACGGKTCTLLIRKLVLDEGFPSEEIVPGTLRPLFMETSLGFFAGLKDQDLK